MTWTCSRYMCPIIRHFISQIQHSRNSPRQISRVFADNPALVLGVCGPRILVLGVCGPPYIGPGWPLILSLGVWVAP